MLQQTGCRNGSSYYNLALQQMHYGENIPITLKDQHTKKPLFRPEQNDKEV